MEIALSQALSLQDPDIALVRRMAAGDEEALHTLYATYGRRLSAYAQRLTGSDQIAEEVLQDSLLAAWKSAESYRGEARVLTWLLGIVHHQALNATRHKRWPTAELGEAAELADPVHTPDSHLEAADRQRALQRALAELSPEHRAVLTLVFYQGLSLSEVAVVLRCPLGTVKSRLSYAKAHLRACLARAGLGAEDLP